MVCDNRSHLQLTAELLFMGQLIDSNERWEFYNAEHFERPSKQELRDIKGIIIPSSNFKIKNKVPRDENVIKQFVKRGNNAGDGAQSELGIESSRGSADTPRDLAALNK